MFHHPRHAVNQLQLPFLNMKRYIAILSALLLICSCMTDRLKEYPDQLVVEGWIENGESPVVFVTSTVAATEKSQNAADLIGHLAWNAQVTVTYNEQTYKLLPTFTQDYLLGLYYTNNALKGVVGGEYRLDVSWNGMTASGTTSIKTPGSIDSISVKVSEDDDTLYVLKAHIKPDENRYYRFFTKVIGQDSTYNASFLGLYDRELIKEDELVFVNRGDSNPFRSQQLYHRYNDSVSFKLAAIDASAYEFWSKFGENSAFGSLALIPYSYNVVGNLDGALGYWFGYGVTKYELKIEN
jgi:hypothetical protein